MPTNSRLSPLGAVLFGLLFVVPALIPILGVLGILPTGPINGTPSWVGVAIGSAFLLAGLILFSDAAAGGLGPDGQLLDSAPKWIRSFQRVTGLVIVVSLALVMSWIAVGSGERHFQSSISLPFVTIHSRSSDATGRWAFGIAAALMWCAVAHTLISAIRKAVARGRAVNDG